MLPPASRNSSPTFPATQHHRDILIDILNPEDPEATVGSAEDLSEDPVYNMIDSYAALLCSAFMHCDVFDKLCYIGTHGNSVLSRKSRDLLVNLLRIVSGIFPESTCSSLLAVPSLVEFATAAGSKSFPDR